MLPKTSIINEIEKYRANLNIKIIANTSNLDKILIRELTLPQKQEFPKIMYAMFVKIHRRNRTKFRENIRTLNDPP